MTITITNGNKGTAKIAVPNSLATKINDQYPEMAMMLAMEELSELSQAISKCVRNGSKDKKDNLAEEIVDVLAVIQWAIDRFDISLQDIQKWADEKHNRMIERDQTDEIIFRSKNAKAIYTSNRISSNGLSISKTKKDGQYILKGDVDNISEYYHVLLTTLRNQNKPEIKGNFNDLNDLLNLFETSANDNIPKDDKSNEKKLTKKQEKKNSKDLDKILEKASKKVKKAKKDDKKDSKKGKKGKK